MEWVGNQRYLQQVLIKGQKEEIRKHKTEKVKWNAEFLQFGTTPNPSEKESYFREHRKRGGKEIEEVDSQKAKVLKTGF